MTGFTVDGPAKVRHRGARQKRSPLFSRYWPERFGQHAPAATQLSQIVEYRKQRDGPAGTLRGRCGTSAPLWPCAARQVREFGCRSTSASAGLSACRLAGAIFDERINTGLMPGSASPSRQGADHGSEACFDRRAQDLRTGSGICLLRRPRRIRRRLGSSTFGRSCRRRADPHLRPDQP